MKKISNFLVKTSWVVLVAYIPKRAVPAFQLEPFDLDNFMPENATHQGVAEFMDRRTEPCRHRNPLPPESAVNKGCCPLFQKAEHKPDHNDCSKQMGKFSHT